MSARRLTELLRPHRWRIAMALVCMGISMLGFLAVPALLKGMLDGAIGSGRLSFPFRTGLLLVGGVGVLAAAGYAASLLMFEVSYRVMAGLRIRYVEHLLHLSMDFHRDKHIGELLDRLVTGLSDVAWFIRTGLTNLIAAAVMLAGSTVMMFVLSWKLALLVAMLVPATALMLRLLYGRIRRLEVRAQSVSGRIIGHVHRMILGIELVKAFNAEDYECKRLQADQAGLLVIQQRSAWSMALVDPFILGMAATTVVLLLLVGGNMLATQSLRSETLIAFFMYALIGLPQARSLSWLVGRWQQVEVALGRLDEVTAVPREADAPGALPVPTPVRGEIEFRDVSYRYAGREQVMDAVSFRIFPGECVGIVGASGAGKTTLFNLLLRFYQPQTGAVLMDGIDIRTVTAASLRDAVAFVPQDSMLLDGTIMDNVRYGRPDASNEEVRAACRAAQTESFIASLPDGYQTVVGEQGLKLSGGQRQRLAVARALIKNAPILLLDEATSSLDAQTERQLQETMMAAAAGRTALIVAHRLATVVRLPRILVLANGKIVGSGTHEHLLQHSPIYRALAATQLITAPADHEVARAS